MVEVVGLEIVEALVGYSITLAKAANYKIKLTERVPIPPRHNFSIQEEPERRNGSLVQRLRGSARTNYANAAKLWQVRRADALLS